MSLRRVAGGVGRALIALGTLLLLFVAFQLWGTGIFEAHSQAVLRSELGRQLPPGTLALEHLPPPRHPAAHRSAPAPASPATPASPSPPPTTTAAPATAPPMAAPAAGQPVAAIDIPSISLDQVVVEGVSEAQLATGPGHYPGTPLPGEAGNVSIAGHRTTYGHPFYNLDQVTPGQQVILTSKQGIFVYTAVSLQPVLPTDLSVIAPSTTPVLTLTTCNPRFSAAQRLVLRATLVRSFLFGAHHPASPARTPGHSPATPAHRVTPAGAGARAVVAAVASRSDLAGAGSDASPLPAVLWGALGGGVALSAWWLAAHLGRRWLVYLGGGAALLVVLFFFFASVTPLLPASF